MFFIWSIKIYCCWLRYLKSTSFTNTISSSSIPECVLVMKSLFKSFSTKVTSKIQSANVFSSCFQKSTKNLISQNLIVYDILGKRKISYDQIRKGLKNLGVLDQLEKTQICFLSYLWQKKLTSEEVMKVLKYDNDVSEKNKEFLNGFLQKCSECKL